MQTFRATLFVVWVVFLAGAWVPVLAQNYPSKPIRLPSKPIRLVIPWPAGGIADLRGRLIGEHLAKALGQPVVIDNRPGADGTIGAYTVAKSRADGYTILLGSNIDQAIAPAVNRELPYEPLRDLLPIVLTGKSYLVLVANPSVPARDAKEFIAWLKTNHDAPAYSSGGNAHAAHLAGVMLKERVGTDLLHVPYKGAAPALIAVLNGEVSIGFDFVATSLPMIEAGKLRAIAVMGPRRLRLLPAVPSVDEVGLENAHAYTWGAFFVAAGTPPPVMKRLQSEFEKILTNKDLIGHVAFSGVEFDLKTGTALADFIRSEQTKWGNLVRTAGIRND